MKWISARKQLPELGIYFVKYWHIGESTTEPCKMAVGVFSYQKNGQQPVFYCMNAGYTEVHPFVQEILWLDDPDEAVS